MECGFFIIGIDPRLFLPSQNFKDVGKGGLLWNLVKTRAFLLKNSEFPLETRFCGVFIV